MAARIGQGQLSFWEATFLMVGAGVGAGIMAVPYLADRVGLGLVLLILVLAYATSGMTHLLLAEVLLRDGGGLQVVELMHRYVFRGRLHGLTWVVFTLLGVAFLAALAAYVAGAGEILASLVVVPSTAAEAAVYAVSAGVVFFGLRAVGAAERLGALGLIVCAGILSAGAVGVGGSPAWPPAGEVADGLAVYGVVMFGYYTFFTVPQVVKGLAPDGRAAVRAILAGQLLNGLLMLVITVVALSVSPVVTEVAIIGIAEGLGPVAGIAGSVFVLLALVTSYWSMSLALADIFAERTGLGRRASWLLATLPSLLVLWLGAWQFLGWLRLAAGLTAIVIATITLPMYVNARREAALPETDWQLGRLGSAPLLGAVFLGTLLMAAGALLGL